MFDSLNSISDVLPFPGLVALISIFLVSLHYSFKNRNLPPGPRGLPFVGMWPFIDFKSSHHQLETFQKKYGDVYSFNILGHLYVNLGTFKDLREAYISKSDCFAIKFEGFSPINFVFGGGVFGLNGEKWRVLRKFFVQLFKQYGMTSSKDYMAGPVFDTLDSVVHELRAKNGERVNFLMLLMDKCSVAVRRILFKDCGLSHEEIIEFNKIYGNLVGDMGNAGILLAGERGRRFILPFIKGHESLAENNNKIHNFLYSVIKKHESTFDDNHIRDVIDSYIKERKERQKRGDPTAKHFTDDALMSTLIQFVGDGVHAVAVLILSFLQALIEYPEDQEKIYKEIIEVMGSDRQPTLDDRSKLPYTNAFFNEVMRTSDIMPFLPSLECTKETTIGGYKIPKGALTLINFWTIHRDPRVYEEPSKFNPSRFLPSDGKPRPELPILFGIGKRACIGEAYTLTLVFLFGICIVKNFRLKFPKDAINKSTLFFSPGNTDMCAYPRHSK